MGASQDTVSVSVRNNGRVGRARWAIRTFQKKATHGSAEREAQGVPYKDDQPAFTLLLFSPARTLSATQLCFARPSLRSYFLPGPTCLLAEPNANAPLHLTNPIHATARNRSLETQTTERQKNERSHAQSPFSRATTNPHLWPPSCARHSPPAGSNSSTPSALFSPLSSSAASSPLSVRVRSNSASQASAHLLRLFFFFSLRDHRFALS